MLREYLIHPNFGTPITEWIRNVPLGIDDDHESLWGILAAAESYGLDADERIEFARRCLRSLLDAGAVPVVFTGKDTPYFARTDRFGTTRDEIVEAVIADWLASGGGDLEWGAYPFTYEANFDPDGWKDAPADGKPSGRDRMWRDIRRTAEGQGH